MTPEERKNVASAGLIAVVCVSIGIGGIFGYPYGWLCFGATMFTFIIMTLMADK